MESVQLQCPHRLQARCQERQDGASTSTSQTSPATHSHRTRSPTTPCPTRPPPPDPAPRQEYKLWHHHSAKNISRSKLAIKIVDVCIMLTMKFILFMLYLHYTTSTVIKTWTLFIYLCWMLSDCLIFPRLAPPPAPAPPLRCPPGDCVHHHTGTLSTLSLRKYFCWTCLLFILGHWSALNQYLVLCW